MDAVPQAGRAVGDLADRVKDLTGALSKAVVRRAAAEPGAGIVSPLPSCTPAPPRPSPSTAPAAQVSTARTVQRRIQPAEPSGEGDDEDAGGAAAEREEVMDSLGFVLSVTAGEAEARARCGEAQDRQRQKWAAAVPAGGALPPEDKLKRLCRKVRVAALAWQSGSHCPAADLHPTIRAPHPQGVPPELRRRVWQGMVTQAGIALGLGRILAVRFPGWGPDLAALLAGMVVLNLLSGPPLFKAGVVGAGEAHAVQSAGAALMPEEGQSSSK